MTWGQLPLDVRQEVAATLNERQLNVLYLHLAGCSHRRIATMLGYKSKTSVRDHLKPGLDLLAEISTRKDAA